LSSSGTGQSGAAPDRHCSLSGVPLTAALLCRALLRIVQNQVKWSKAFNALQVPKSSQVIKSV
jgi:hypothetical protein